MSENATPITAFEEQGWRVYEVSEYEYYAARDRGMAISDALRDWGCSLEDGFPEGTDEVDAVDLDQNLININEDEDPAGPIITFREQLRRLLADGKEIAGFFCALDI